MAKRRRQVSRKSQVSRSGSVSTKSNQFFKIGIGLLAVGLLAFGAFQFLSDDSQVSPSTAAAVEIDSGSLESTSIEAGRTQGAAVAAEPVSDRMVQYLGPSTDAATLVLAEAGQLGQPTLVFFHADW